MNSPRMRSWKRVSRSTTSTRAPAFAIATATAAPPSPPPTATISYSVRLIAIPQSSAEDRRSFHIQENPFVDERGLVLSHDLDLGLGCDLRSLRLRFDCDHTRARMDLGACRDGRDEAQFVRAVVDHVAEIGDVPLPRNLEGRYEAEGQEAMRDRPLERTLALGTFDIDMDPLMVAGHVGELIDLVLRHFDRLAPGAEILADLRAKFLNVVKADAFHSFPPVAIWRLSYFGGAKKTYVRVLKNVLMPLRSAVRLSQMRERSRCDATALPVCACARGAS